MTTTSQNVPHTLRDTFFTDPFFRDTFDDFSQLYRAMMDESREFWAREEEEKKIPDPIIEDKPLSALTEMTKQPEDYASWFFPRRWLLPRLFGGGEQQHLLSPEVKTNPDPKMKSMDLFQHLGDDNSLRLTDNDKKFEVSLDTHGYKPEEVKVAVENGKLVVEGKHEVKDEDRYVYRHFKRAYAMPKECDADHVVSNLSSDGVLMITAPKREAING